MQFKILIVDDHPLIRWAIEQLLRGHPDYQVCDSVDSVSGALQSLKKHKPDLIILDLLLKQGSGKEIISHVAKEKISCRILVSSMCQDPLLVSSVIREGVDGFVDKGCSIEHLLECIQAVLAGQTMISPAIQGLCVDAIRQGGSRDAKSNPAFDELSRREYEVFRLLGRNYNSHEIADKLGLALKTVHTHKQNIRQKLRLRTMAELNGKAAIHMNADNPEDSKC